MDAEQQLLFVDITDGAVLLVAEQCHNQRMVMGHQTMVSLIPSYCFCMEVSHTDMLEN